MEQNKKFRKKNMKAAKVEDLYFYLSHLKQQETENEKLISEIQRFIEFNFNYEPVRKDA